MYDHDPDGFGRLGWEEFIARQWESIFAGYRSRAGLRSTCRRWSDLLEAGLGCSQEIADLLVRAEIVQRADRDLEGTRDAGKLLAGMDQVLADVRGRIGRDWLMRWLEDPAKVHADARMPALFTADRAGLTEARRRQLLDKVLQGDDPCCPAVFVDDDRQMCLVLAHF